jgi:transposase-like protein
LQKKIKPVRDSNAAAHPAIKRSNTKRENSSYNTRHHRWKAHKCRKSATIFTTDSTETAVSMQMPVNHSADKRKALLEKSRNRVSSLPFKELNVKEHVKTKRKWKSCMIAFLKSHLTKKN